MPLWTMVDANAATRKKITGITRIKPISDAVAVIMLTMSAWPREMSCGEAINLRNVDLISVDIVGDTIATMIVAASIMNQ